MAILRLSTLMLDKCASLHLVRDEPARSARPLAISQWKVIETLPERQNPLVSPFVRFSGLRKIADLIVYA